LFSSLNEEQDTAVKHSCRQIVSAIHGPPGSGKTVAAVEIIIEWMRRSSEPILACGDNQQSTDELYVELSKAGI
jgi:Ni2+-binding GTPase involved in maturation of urease and hydrogenase